MPEATHRSKLDSGILMTQLQPSPGAPAAWRTAIPALVLLLGSVFALYWDTFLAMVNIWHRSETFTHGFLVLPIVLWLVWRRRDALAARTPSASALILLPLLAMALMWLLGDLVGVNSVTQLAFVAMLALCVPAILGMPFAMAIAFPLGFLFFAVPIGEFLLPTMIDRTADFVVVALRASGIPVLRDGRNFVIPSGSWAVVEACSGVRYLIASLTVGTLYAYLNYQSMRRRIMFIGVAILVPIVANWLRAYMIVMTGHYSGNTIAVGVDHLIYGWVFFGIVILLMFIIGARWAEPEPHSDVQKARRSGSQQSPVPAGRMWLVAIAVAIVLALPLVAKSALEANAITAKPSLVLNDADLQPWQAADATEIGFTPHFGNSSADLNKAYSQADRVVGVYLGYYRNQDYSRKLVSSDNELVNSSSGAWTLVGRGTTNAVAGTSAVLLRSGDVRRGHLAPVGAPERLLAWQFYWVNGKLTSNDYLAKVYGAAFQLMGRGDDAAVIVVYTKNDDAGSARQTLAAFLSAHYGAIDSALRSAADSR